MKVRLVNGYLQIQRPNGWRDAWCPFSRFASSAVPELIECGEWCPLFTVAFAHEQMEVNLECGNSGGTLRVLETGGHAE